MRAKMNPVLVGAIVKLKKTNVEAAKLLARPVKKWSVYNLSDIKENSFIAGKVLSSGDLEKKVKIVAWSASEKAVEKIKKAGGEFVPVVEEIKKNPELKNLKVLE